ncbi:glycosyltransferase family 2 protein [Helicobacter mustelae]|uniref:glycosyltransferase family 2 protein n=1 Tax=Helicobacter mustelae TaxID=217 RepID=UPI0002D4B9DF|nr:glycosyltransferase [Helicobacter mustelae]SQH71299.1 LPS biosynthesis-related glycosyltransferase [Helicobacter mustelae]STP12427.1 LPS biosynthesis-related glycosyltransferase [Helicobacter mustelae]
MAFFSIIVPIYNVELYLRECIDSLIHQSFKDIEIILINDGSTDSSGAIAEEYARKDPRIHLINQENQGLSMARNAGLSHCSKSKGGGSISSL